MRYKAFLRTADNVYILSPKITTIGRESCDLVIQSQVVDDQHAMIEFIEAEDCFVIKDLDTNQGTYVNDCRVQNAAVRLAPGDVIRFGYPGQPYEFSIESGVTQVIYPPVSQPRPTWHQQQPSLRFIGDTSGGGGVPLPNINTNVITPKPAATQQPLQPILNAWGTSPYPPNNSRPSRPSSATRRQPSAPSPVPPRGGWVTGPTRGANYSPGRESPVSDLILQEKETKLMQLQSEIARLQAGDENPHAIEMLRQQVAALQIQLTSLAADTSVRCKLVQLEQEVANKKTELAQLRDRLQQMSQAPNSGATIANNAADAMELLSVRSELDRVRKDKQITSGLVNQLQKDLTTKDATVNRLNREVEALKKTIDEKEANLMRMQSSVEDGRKTVDPRDREIAALRQKFKVAENKVQEQSSFIHVLKSDIDKANVELRNNEEKLAEAFGRLENAKLEYIDLQRSERIARGDMQEASKRFERLRNRAMQIAFSVGQSEPPEGEVKDDEVIDMLKRILDDRNTSMERLTILESEVQSKGTIRQEMEDATAKFAAHLNAMNERLRGTPNITSGLSDEITLLLTEPVCSTLQAIKEATVNAMRLQLDWHREVESALETCGVNTRLSSERPKQHILDLNSKLEAAKAEVEQVRSRLQSLVSDHETELSKLAESLKSEREEAVKDALEKSQLSGENPRSDELTRQAVEAAVSEKVSHYEALLAEDSKKMEELNESISQLQQSLIEKQSDFDNRMKEAETSVVKVEALQETVSELEMELNISRADVQKFSEQATTSQAECRRLSQELRASRSSPTETTDVEKVRVELQAAREEITRLSELQVEAEKTPINSRPPSQESKRSRTSPVVSSELERLKTELQAAREELAMQTNLRAESRSDEVETLKLEIAALEESRSLLMAQLKERGDSDEPTSEGGRLTDEVERLLKENSASFAEVQRLLKENSEAIDKVQQVEAEKVALSFEVERMKEEMKRAEKEDARSEASRRSSVDARTIRNELESAACRIRELNTELEGLRNREQVDELVTDLQARLASSETTVTRLTADLELSRNLAMKVEELEAKELSMKLKLDEEKSSKDADVEAYKLQVHQHSVTICSLEERVEKVVKRNQELEGRVSDLTKENKNLRKRRSTGRQTQQDNGTGPSRQQQNSNFVQQNVNNEALPPVVMSTAPIEVAALERSLLGLRQENANLKKGLVERESTIQGLKQDLSGATARLSDMQGELTDEQKNEIHLARTQVKALQDRLDESQSKLAQLSKMVDNLNEIIAQRDETITKQTKNIGELEKQIKSKEEEMRALEEALNMEKERSSTQLMSMEDEGKITSELTAMGAQCRGERHEQIICHQKEALAELRSRVKKLENVRAPQVRAQENMVSEIMKGPAMPSHDQAVQQVVLLKKELAELRSSMALKENKLNLPNHLPALTDQRRADNQNTSNITTGYVPERALEQQRTELTNSIDEERAAHRQTMKALEESEKSFNDMLRALASTIELESISGITSIAHLNSDERDLVRGEREQAIGIICQRIKVLTDRLQRKEELLQNYEKDLARLSQAELLATKKHDQVEKLVKDIRARTEETAMLRQSLSNTREVLNREKLLNDAIKQKKTFHMEVKKMPKPPIPQTTSQPKQHCPREDIFNREEQRKQRAKDRERRKSYEISTLKSKLTARERELTRTTTKLAAMETTMGLNVDPQFE